MRQCGVILYRVFLCAVILLGGINGQGTTCIAINATHHPCEYINTVLVLNQIEHILGLFRDNAKFQGLSVRQLLSKSQIHFVPLVNPDGLEAYNTYLKTGSLEEGFSKATIGIVNANNVNLNRNYDANFRAQTQNSGPAPFSEPGLMHQTDSGGC